MLFRSVPEQDNLPPLKNLLATALQNRTDLAVQKINISNAEISNLGTENGLLPQLALLLGASAQGLAGPYRIGTIANAIPVTSTTGTGTGATSGSGSSGSTTTTVALPTGAIPCPAGTAPGTLCIAPLGNFVGGITNGLSQAFERDFPSERAGGFIYAPFRNRQAQADYGIDQLTLRQTQLQLQQRDRKSVV